MVGHRLSENELMTSRINASPMEKIEFIAVFWSIHTYKSNDEN
jgi:hypothetical protein